MASAVIGALRVNLGIDTAQFENGLKGIRGGLDRFGRGMQNIGASFSKYLSVPLAGAATAVTAAVTSMANDVQELQKSAELAGTGFEQFQRLAFAAKSVGFESDKLADIYKDVNDKVGDFMQTGGGPMADFFTKIAPKVNLTAEAFKNLSGPQALQLYYDSLVKAGVSQSEMTFYLEALANDATALVPLLREGGKGFAELGAQASVISGDQAAGLKAYNDQMRLLGEAIKAIVIAVATSGLLEWVTGIAQSLAEWLQVLAQTNPEILKWGTVVAGLASVLGPVIAAVGLFVTGIAAISAPVLLVVAGIAALTAAVIAFWPEIQRTAEVVSAFVSGAWAQFVAAWDGLVEKISEVKQAVVQFAADLVQAFVDLHVRMYEIGSQIMEGLWQGLKDKFSAVKDGLVGYASDLISGVKSTLGIHSPSKVMHGVGVNVMQGLGNGMDSMTGAVQSTANSIGSTISNSFKGLIDGSKTVKDVLSDLAGQLSSMLMNRGFQMLFGGMGGGGNRSGGGLFGGLFSGIGNWFGSLFGFANGGSFQVGGSGGIDSQLVAFRASPDERVSINKPGDERGAGGVALVEVAASPYFDTRVSMIADDRAGAAVAQGQQQAQRTFPAMQADRTRRYG